MGFVEDNLKPAGFGATEINDILTACEEIIVNVMRYAYSAESGEIWLECGIRDGFFLVEVSDSGAPFNILAVPDPDISKPIEDREIGGLGIFLAKRLTDGMNYERKDDRNIVQMMKKLPETGKL